jgi:NTE family protein
VVVKPINLALQGGGTHSVFTWCVLDRLLPDSRLEIEGISATSIGAMNAAADRRPKRQNQAHVA